MDGYPTYRPLTLYGDPGVQSTQCGTWRCAMIDSGTGLSPSSALCSALASPRPKKEKTIAATFLCRWRYWTCKTVCPGQEARVQAQSGGCSALIRQGKKTQLENSFTSERLMDAAAGSKIMESK